MIKALLKVLEIYFDTLLLFLPSPGGSLKMLIEFIVNILKKIGQKNQTRELESNATAVYSLYMGVIC